MTCDVEEKPFTFDQLSDKAKEKARDKWRYSPGYLDHGWWEHVYTDAVRVGALMGFEIQDDVSHGTDGKVYTKPDIWFHGFCSQGDGACWSGYLVVAQLQDGLARIKGECPADETLHDIARAGEELFAQFATLAAFNRLCSDDTNRDWPEVTTSMRIQVEGNDRHYSTRTDNSDGNLPMEIEKAADALVESFAAWIFDQLEQENDYLMSDEVVDDALDSACLSFDEHGNEL